MQYWKTHQKSIILTHLNLINDKKLNFVIWQQKNEQRYTYHGSFKVISRTTCQIKIDESELDLFDNEIPFFCHISELDIIFKKDHYNRMGQFLEFSLPSDIQIYERRKNKRYHYLYQDHKNITYHSEHNDPKTHLPVFVQSSVLVDISTTGAGMVVGEEAIKQLNIGQNLLLDNLTDQKLPEPFKVKIKYIENYKFREIGLFKVGIIFNDQLDSISYKSISSIVEIKQRKTSGLSSELYCGLNHEEQVRAINSIEVKNKTLANNIKDNIEYLDRLRYMTTQMKVGFLKTINHDLLSVALRLSSKELIYDLFSELTENIQHEFLEKLQTEKPASAVCKAQDEIIKIMRAKEKNGEIVLDPTAFTTYV